MYKLCQQCGCLNLLTVAGQWNGEADVIKWCIMVLQLRTKNITKAKDKGGETQVFYSSARTGGERCLSRVVC